MKNLKFVSVVLAVTLVASFTNPMTANAQSLISNENNDTITSIRQHIENKDTDVEDSSVFDNSMGDVDTGNTENGNSTVESNSNKGDGVNSNVSTSDTVETDANFNVSDINVRNNKNNSKDKNHTTVNNTDRSKNITIVSNNSSSGDVSASSGSNTSSKSNSSTSTSKKNSSVKEKVEETLDDIIDDEENNQWEIILQKDPTCTEKGEIILYNPATKETVVEEIAAKSHDLVTVTTKGGFLSPSQTETYCSDCGAVVASTERTVAKETSEGSSSKLPIAGAFGTIGAVLLAFLRRH